jgi:hypothetical protein
VTCPTTIRTTTIIITTTTGTIPTTTRTTTTIPTITSIPTCTAPTIAAELQLLTDQFIDGFVQAKDKMSYLRLAGVPLERPGRDGGPSMKLVDVRLTTEWQVGTASPSFGSRELSYLPFPGEMITERTNMGLVYVSLDAKEVHDIRHLLAERGLD